MVNTLARLYLRRSLFAGVALFASAASANARADSLFGDPLAPAETRLPAAEPEALSAFPWYLSAEKLAGDRRSRAPKEAPPAANGKIDVRRFKKMLWSPEKGYFQATGDVEVTYETPALPDKKGLKVSRNSVLEAKRVEYTAETGDINAKERIIFHHQEGVFTGQSIEFNLRSNKGVIEDATLKTGLFRMSGKKIAAQSDGSYLLEDGEFTTCENDRPDYRIRAKSLKVTPNQYVNAKGIKIYLGATQLASLPSYRYNFRRTTTLGTFRPGYNRVEGLSIRRADSPIRDAHQALDYDLSLSVRGVPIGFIYYQRDLVGGSESRLPSITQSSEFTDPLRSVLEQLSPPVYQASTESRLVDDYAPRATFFAAVQSRQFSYTRRTQASQVTRLPEIGVRFTNIFGKSAGEDALSANEAALAAARGDTRSLLQRYPRTPFLLDASASFGNITEAPSNVTSGRFGVRINFASQPLTVAPRTSLRFGLTNWFSAYSRGGTYNIVSPEADLNYAPTSTSLFGIGYRFALDAGRTPFLFDRRDMRQELRLRFQVGGAWAFGYLMRYDLERATPFDTEIAIMRNLDCLQAGFAYRFRSQQFNLIFNLTPPVPKRAKAQERQAQAPRKETAFAVRPKKPATAPEPPFESMLD